MKEERVKMFVDGSNCFHLQNILRWTVDHKQMIEYCGRFGIIVEATYYTGVSDDSNQRKFHDTLAYIGYSLVTKPVKTIYDPTSEKTIQKANLDVEIALDMFNTIDQYDVAVLVSGDGDFERAVRMLKSRGKDVKVISTRGCVARELVHAVGINYIDFMDIREFVEKK